MLTNENAGKGVVYTVECLGLLTVVNCCLYDVSSVQRITMARTEWVECEELKKAREAREAREATPEWQEARARAEATCASMTAAEWDEHTKKTAAWLQAHYAKRGLDQWGQTPKEAQEQRIKQIEKSNAEWLKTQKGGTGSDFVDQLFDAPNLIAGAVVAGICWGFIAVMSTPGGSAVVVCLVGFGALASFLNGAGKSSY